MKTEQKKTSHWPRSELGFRHPSGVGGLSKCPAHVSTVRMGLGTFGGTAWIISFLKVEFLYQGFE